MFPNPFLSLLGMASGARLVRETLEAANMVVNKRSSTIGAAIRDPFNADTVELALMVQEKTACFSAAGASIARDWLQIQADCAAQALAIGRIMLSGKLPRPKATRAILARSRRIGGQALGSGTRALKPIHAAATANARRLGKPR